MPSDGSALVKLLVYIPALVMGVYLMFGFVKLYRSSREPEKTRSATVLDKRISRVKPLTNKVKFPGKPEYNHYVTFQIEGHCMEMLVTEDVYDSLKEGSTGSLTCKGANYVNFE